jgi:hypothetical protein
MFLRKWIISFFCSVCVLFHVAALSGQSLQTASEASGFERHTTYEEMISYLNSIRKTSTDLLLGTYGTSLENRELPYVLLSRPLVTQPWEAFTLNKPILVFSANVHGGERTLRESLLILLRELTTPGSEANALLDKLVLIIVPSINVDGFSATPEGTRGNALGVDLNRDYMKLEHITLVNYVRNILLSWHPHLIIDGHNGGSYPYNICYQGPSHAASDQRLTLLCDTVIFPLVNLKMEQEGFKTFYYTRGDSTVWRTGGYDPRISRNYAGLINSVGILFESPKGHSLETGVRSGIVAFKTILEYAAHNADELMEHVARARYETVEMGRKAYGEIPVQMEYEPEDYKVSYEIPVGPPEDRALVKITNADLLKKTVITKSRPRPYAYLLETKALKAVELLKRHKIMIETLQEDTEILTEAYVLTGIERDKEYDHPSAAVVTVADETVSERRMFSKGSYIIRTGQFSGRVVTHLLEPETNDNVIRWNTMDALLPELDDHENAAVPRSGRQSGNAISVETRIQQDDALPVLPIFKIMKPIALPTKILHY